MCPGRPGPFWAPRLQPYFCSVLQDNFARDASAERAPPTSNANSHRSSATQLSCSRSRVPVCLHVLLVPERVPWEPCASRRFSSSSSSRPLLLVFFQVYQARLTPACQFQRINLLFYPLVTGSTDQISFSYSNSSAYQLSHFLTAQLTFLCYCRFVTIALCISHLPFA